MTPAEIVKLVLIVSIVLITLSLGLRSTLAEATWLVRRPAKLVPSLAAIFLAVPAFALWLCLTFPLEAPVKIALVALAVSPLPPLLPGKQEGAGAEHAYALSLLITAAVLAIGLTPLLLALAGRVFGIATELEPPAVIGVVAKSILVPLAAGIALKTLAPALADRLQPFANKTGYLLLGGAALAMLWATGRDVLALVGNGTIFAIAALMLFGLFVGHILAGGDKADRSALALAAASRHPGLALAIIGANFPEYAKPATAAVLLCLLVNALVSFPYLRWVKQGQPQGEG